ncbi:sugar ABC transporter ATP-binding protein [Ensifer sp. ENS06]|uniref:sugar ABC transporter ATP-binding protein n=1 Tax=Ensifer sp. ENS06 TaxID=2769276 RepID=UPI00177F4C5E|nr:sugar ABC transporter ATP-binding protein [Ensifer sp. ENS06]MBD9626948.1 sugar ABC transporter ATP-binding protein [Ensifer sp. ENS06]
MVEESYSGRPQSDPEHHPSPVVNSPSRPVFEAEDVYKVYGNVRALEGVSLAGYAGEVLAICGANGAGKSTLSKLLAGLVRPSTGTILLAGEPMRHNSPREGIEAGVLMMYQEPLIVDHLSVEENLWLFDLNRRWSSLRLRRDRSETRKLLDRVGLSRVDPDRPAGELTPGNRHMLALARVFIVQHRLLILDETTASTNEEHFRIVVDIVRHQKAQGACVIFVSHKLNEVRELADRIAVLRDGKLIDVVSAEKRSEEDISAMMIGERLSALEPKSAPAVPDEAPLLEVRNFRSGRVQGVDLTVRPGEVVGLYGLVGSGRSTVGRALGGHFHFAADKLRIAGKNVAIRSPREAIASGICYLTEDRHKEGFIPHFSNQSNMSLVILDTLSRRRIIDHGQEARLGTQLIEQFQIKGSLEGLTVDLSGGNQQKVCVAKWAASSTKLLIIDEPTKGVDVGAKRQIYEIIEEFARQGKGVLLISSEAEELMHLSDRAIVMAEYEVAAEFKAGSYNKTELISTALGDEVRRAAQGRN